MRKTILLDALSKIGHFNYTGNSSVDAFTIHEIATKALTEYTSSTKEGLYTEQDMDDLAEYCLTMYRENREFIMKKIKAGDKFKNLLSEHYSPSSAPESGQNLLKEIYDNIIPVLIKHKKRFTDKSGIHHDSFNEHNAMHEILGLFKSRFITLPAPESGGEETYWKNRCIAAEELIDINSKEKQPDNFTRWEGLVVASPTKEDFVPSVWSSDVKEEGKDELTKLHDAYNEIYRQANEWKNHSEFQGQEITRLKGLIEKSDTVIFEIFLALYKGVKLETMVEVQHQFAKENGLK